VKIQPSCHKGRRARKVTKEPKDLFENKTSKSLTMLFMTCHAMLQKQKFTSRTRVVALNPTPTPKDKERLLEL
jgi:hypothetical protein